MTLLPGSGPRSSGDPFSSVTPGFVFLFCNPVPVGRPWTGYYVPLPFHQWLARMDLLEILPLSMRCVFQFCVRNPLELWTGLVLFCRLP